MIAIRMGKTIGTDDIRWEEKSGDLLYLDQVRRQLWVWLPAPCPDRDRVGLEIRDQPLRIGEYDGASKGLFRFPITADQQQLLSTADVAQFTLAPPPLDIATERSLCSMSVYQYIQSTQNPDRAVLRRFAWFASVHSDQSQQLGIEAWERRVKSEDLVGINETVDRDSGYFDHLKEIIATRRLALLLGGVESGLSTFFDQFQRYLQTRHPGSRCFTADFREDNFVRFIKCLEEGKPLLRDLGLPETHSTALYLSLAYSAYEQIAVASNTNRTRLNEFIISSSSPNAFVVKYVAPFAGGYAHRNRTQFEHFLAFLGELMEAAGGNGTLTVLLSFPGLFSWLKEHRNENIASITLRQLWEDLRIFANNNFEVDTGLAKPGSALQSLAPSIGIAIELQRLPFNGIGEAFCRQHVLALPPVNMSELQKLWLQLTGVAIETDIAQSLLDESGGHPWFLSLLLDCILKVLSSPAKVDKEKYRAAVKTAIDIVRTLIASRGNEPENAEGEHVTGYFQRLESVVTAATRTDLNVLQLLRIAQTKPVRIPPDLRVEEWLESGLFWPCPPAGTPSELQGFARFPNFVARPQGRLMALAVTSLISE